MSNWTINGSTLAALGITGATLTRACWAAHSLALSADGRAATAPALFANGAAITLRLGGTIRFVGQCQPARRSARGEAEGHAYEVLNAWQILEETVFQQAWAVRGVTHPPPQTTELKGRCILGVKADGTAATVGEVMAEVLAFAGVASGTIDLGQYFEPFEVLNVMCSEALSQLARKVPRAVSWWTYPGGVPTFHAALDGPSAALEFAADTSVDLAANGRQKVRGVVLRYEVTSKTDDEQQVDVVTDSAGATSGRGVLLQTIPWQGFGMTFLKQKMKVRTIEKEPRPGGDANQIAALKRTRKFWAERCKELRTAKAVAGDADTPEITFLPLTKKKNGVVTEALPPGSVGFGPTEASTGFHYFAIALASVTGTDGTGAYELTNPDADTSEKIRLDAGLLRYIVEGTITPWMVRNGKTGQRWVLHARVTYFAVATDVLPSEAEDKTVNLTATDCTNRVYTSLSEVTAGNPVPTGQALVLYNQLKHAVHEGTITRVEEECSGFVEAGWGLTVTGGAAEWAAMKTVAQTVTEDLATGTTSVSVGAGEHRGVSDLLEICRMDRRRTENDTRDGAANLESRGNGLP